MKIRGLGTQEACYRLQQVNTRHQMKAILLLSFMLGPVSTLVAGPPTTAKPSIFFILADDLGYGDLG